MSKVLIKIVGLALFLFSNLLVAQLDLQEKYSYEQLQLALSKARSVNNHQQLADAYFLLAHYEQDKFNDEQAFEYYTRSLVYYNIVGDTDQIQIVKRVIAKGYLVSGLYTQAIESFEELLDYYQDQGSLRMLTRINLDLADAYRGKGDTELELLHETRALNLNKELRDTLLNLEILAKKLESYLLINELDSAFQIASQTIRESEAINNQKLLAKAYIQKAKVLKKRNKHPEALEALAVAEQYIGDKPFDQNRLNMYDIFSVSHAQLKDYESAFDYGTRYTQLNDSILNNERINSLNNLTFRFEAKEKNKAVKVLELKNDNALEKNQQQRRALYVLGIGLALLLALLYYIIRFYNQRIKANLIINKQKDEINNQKIAKLEDDIKISSMQFMIEGQEIERERIAKDLHDSLGGLLSTVKLQFDSVKSSISSVEQVPEYIKAHNLLDTAVNEVRSISQNLQPSALEKLGLVKAINDLINRFNGKGHPEIDFQCYSFPEHIDKMTSLSIYRIIQELLHNAIKHAQAKEVMLQLTKEEEEIIIYCEDDGTGFDTNSIRKGAMGLDNIKSRVNYLKGSFSIDTKKNEGTSFVLHIPYAE